MITKKLVFVLALLAVLLLVATTPSWALIVATTTADGNTTAPTETELADGDPGFIHVAERGLNTAVYVGYGWVLTAKHVGAGNVTIDGTSYAYSPGTVWTTGIVDLRLFRISDIPRLPALTIASAPPTVGDEVVMVGQCNDYVPYGTTGFTVLGSGSEIRWGTNKVSEGTRTINVGSGTYVYEGFRVTFDESGSDYEAQAYPGDSGGAVFHNNEGEWELSGIISAVDGSNAYANPVLYGRHTYSVDLSEYRDQIIGHITPLSGDANLDGIVNDIDATILAANWNMSEALWIDGDFNADRTVNGIDATILASNWQQSAAPIGGASASAVPEPTTAILLLIGSLSTAALHFRRRACSR